MPRQFSGRKLKAQRERSCLSLTQLANAVGVCRSTIASWQSGRRQPMLDALTRLADVLGCGLDDLME